MRILLTLLLMLLVACVQERKNIDSSSCKGKINIQYDKTISKGLMSNNKKLITVFFLNDFDNQIKGYINGNLKFNEMVVTDKSTGKSDKNFAYRYDKDKTLPILKIERDDDCFAIKIKKDYKLIYVFYDSSKVWTVRFSNRYYIEN